MKQWYVARGKKRDGPYTSGGLRQLVARGKVVPADMLFLESAPGTLVGYRLDSGAEAARVSTSRTRGVN